MDSNLLNDPLILTEDAAKSRQLLTLPAVLEGLGQKKIQNFPRLRAHQGPYFHMFLCQLAALAMEAGRLAVKDLPEIDAATWHEVILKLTPDYPHGEAWELINEDESVPAFLQPPVQLGAKDGKDAAIHRSPDEIDLIVQSRTHSQKTNYRDAELEHWIHALICRQTAGGYGGKGNFGVMRAPGANHPRYLVSLIPSTSPADRFCRDVAALLATKGEIIQKTPFLDLEHKIPFLWTLPWDGVGQIAPNAIGPWTIEVAMRLRLHRSPLGVVCTRRLSSGRRISEGTIKSESLLGAIGDPWAPISASTHAMPPMEEGNPSLEWLARLMFDTQAFSLSPLGRHIDGVDGNEPMKLRIEGIHSKDSKTIWVERTIDLPKRSRVCFGMQDTPAVQDMLADIPDMHSTVLMPAMFAWYEDEGQGIDPATGNDLRQSQYPILRSAFSRAAEPAFFANAAEAAIDPAGALKRWREAAMEAAEAAYDQFLAAMPTREGSSRRRRARGLGALRTLLAKFGNSRMGEAESSNTESTSQMSYQTERGQQIGIAVAKILDCVQDTDFVPAPQLAQIETFDVKNIGQRVPNVFWKILGQSLPGELQGEVDGRERFAWFAVVKAAAISMKLNSAPLDLGSALSEGGIGQIRYDHIMQPHDENDARDVLISTAKRLAGDGINFRIIDIAHLLLLKGAERDAVIEEIDRIYVRGRQRNAGVAA